MDAEILVHITAPSRASDDTHYRALAQAYLDFEPATRTDLVPDNSFQAGSFQMPLPIEVDDNVIESPNLSFQSVWHNAGSPNLRKSTLFLGDMPIRSQSQSTELPLSQTWVSPPSVVPDSQPENDLRIPTYCSPTRLLEHYLQNLDNSLQSGPSETSQQQQQQQQQRVHRTERIPELVPSSVAESLEDVQLIALPAENNRRETGSPTLGATVLGGVEPSSTSTLRPTLPDAAAPSEIRDSFPLPSMLVEPGTPTLPITIPSSRADSEPPPAKRRRASRREDEIKAIVRSSSDAGPHAATRQPDPYHQTGLLARSRSSNNNANSGSGSLEIHAPAPPVSCDDIDPSSLVTPKLTKLAHDLAIARRFRPQAQTREVRPFERGYWLVDTSAWPSQLREQAWVFLGNYVGSGDAGWGVWCRRDAARRWIRLFCFGAVAGHAYLLLYLASQREMLLSGAVWHDAAGEAVITVRPRKGST